MAAGRSPILSVLVKRHQRTVPQPPDWWGNCRHHDPAQVPAGQERQRWLPRLPPEVPPAEAGLPCSCSCAAAAQRSSLLVSKGRCPRLFYSLGHCWLGSQVCRGAGPAIVQARGPCGEGAAGHSLARRMAEARLSPPPVTLIKGGAAPSHWGQFVQRGTLGLQAGGRYHAGQLRGASAH